jgi:hypothetical protein
VQGLDQNETAKANRKMALEPLREKARNGDAVAAEALAKLHDNPPAICDCGAGMFGGHTKECRRTRALT